MVKRWSCFPFLPLGQKLMLSRRARSIGPMFDFRLYVKWYSRRTPGVKIIFCHLSQLSQGPQTASGPCRRFSPPTPRAPPPRRGAGRKFLRPEGTLTGEHCGFPGTFPVLTRHDLLTQAAYLELALLLWPRYVKVRKRMAEMVPNNAETVPNNAEV